MPIDNIIVVRSRSCADELVVGGGVGWSYGRPRRWRQTGWESTETAHSLDRRFFSGFTGVSHFTCDIRWAADAKKL